MCTAKLYHSDIHTQSASSREAKVRPAPGALERPPCLRPSSRALPSASLASATSSRCESLPPIRHRSSRQRFHGKYQSEAVAGCGYSRRAVRPFRSDDSVERAAGIRQSTDLGADVASNVSSQPRERELPTLYSPAFFVAAVRQSLRCINRESTKRSLETSPYRPYPVIPRPRKSVV